MAAEIPLDQQRPAEFMFSRHVQQELDAIHRAEKNPVPPMQAAE
jgi:hypothetical protein